MPRSAASGRTAATNRVAVQDIKSSLSFNGTSSNIAITSLVPTVNGGSCAFWIKSPPVNNSYSRIFVWRDASGVPYGGFDLQWFSTSRKPVMYLYNDSNASTSYTSTKEVKANDWSLVICQWTQSTISFYIDNVSAGSGAISAWTAPTASTPRIMSSSTGFSWSKGAMCNFIYADGTQWTAAQREAIYSGIAPKGASVILKLDEGAGYTAYDTSGNGNHGTITNGTFTSDVPTRKRGVVGGNLVYNGEFEYAPPFVAATTTTARWIDGTAVGSTTNSLFGWGFRTVSGSCAAQFDSINKRSGNYSLKLSTTATGSMVFVYYNSINGNIDKTLYNIPSKPNTSYTLSYWMKTSLISGSSTGARIGVQKKNVAGVTGEEFTNSIGIATTTDWTYYSFTFTTNAALDTPYLFVVPQIVGQDGAGTLIMDAWFDDITITPTVNTTRTAV